MHLIASLHFPIIHINRHTTHTHRCMQYINTAGNSGSDTHTLMHTRQCTHTVIWLNMLQNIARWFWSDIFITLHPLLVFNAILLPQLLLSISGTGHISFCACVRGTVCVCVRVSKCVLQIHFPYLLCSKTPAKHSFNSSTPFIPASHIWAEIF